MNTEEILEIIKCRLINDTKNMKDEEKKEEALKWMKRGIKIFCDTRAEISHSELEALKWWKKGE